MFSMSGIPPFAGFFGKLFVFQAAVEAGYIYLAVIGVLTSVVAASAPRRPMWAAVINSVCCPKLQCAMRMR